MKIQNNPHLSIEQLQEQYLNQTKKATSTSAKIAEGLTFQDIFKQKIQGGSEVRFSKHAVGRLQDRNIELTDSQLARLQEGTQKAGAKGIQESLVLVDQLAFIVNIPNNTVVTAMDQTEASDNIYTNIDGAVII